MGFEPINAGVKDQCLTYLATSNMQLGGIEPPIGNQIDLQSTAITILPQLRIQKNSATIIYAYGRT